MKNYMERAIKLARKGIYTTRPNPSVGCVIVKDTGQGEQIIGEGITTERVSRTQKCMHYVMQLYLILEPCSFTGIPLQITHGYDCYQNSFAKKINHAFKAEFLLHV